MISRLSPRLVRGAILGFCLALLGVSACDKVPLLAPTQSTITLATNRRILPVNGTAEITATVVEQSGTPVHNGTLVTFTTTLGTVEPREAQTDGGQIRAILHAGQQSGTAVVGAFSGSARAQTLEIQIGAAAVQAIVLSVSPGTVSPLGGSVQLTASVTDASGNQLPGVPVTFAASAGILSSSTAVTDDNGDARVTLTTSRETTVTANAGSKQATATIRANTAPTVTVSTATQTPTALQTVSFTVNVTAGSSPIRAVTIDFGDGSSQALGALTGNSSVSHTYRSGGTYTVTAAVLDSNGERASVSTVVDVRPPTPINVTVTASNSSPQVNAAVTFTATVTASGVTISRFEWDFGDGTSTVTTGSAASHVYQSAGRRTITVTAVSTEGTRGTGQVEINVAAVALNVTISASASPTVTQPVTFTATTTPATTAISSYRWDFGDGTTRTTSGNVTSHAYSTPGNKAVSVSATSADGASAHGQLVISVAQVSVTLAAAPSNNPPVNSVVTFTATVSPAGVSVDHYEWSFGDGSAIISTSGNTTTHIYTSAASSITVRVTVVLLDGGRRTAQIEIKVG